jgi:hypothetical protein
MNARRLIATGLLGALLAVTSGCFNPFDPLISSEREASQPAPIPSSPANAVRLFEWCWKNRGIKEYEELFTDDYRFQFALNDSAGNAYRDVPFTREDELRSAIGLFIGTPDHLPASDIKLDLDKTLIKFKDDRPGKDSTWHQYIRTSVDLQVTIESGAGAGLNGGKGYAKLYLVRGDSAAIPPELASLGFKPDSNRWWIERWEDETLTSGSAMTRSGGSVRVKPARTDTVPQLLQTTFGQVKVRGL